MCFSPPQQVHLPTLLHPTPKSPSPSSPPRTPTLERLTSMDYIRGFSCPLTIVGVTLENKELEIDKRKYCVTKS